MKINLVSSSPLTDDFVNIMTRLVKAKFPEIKGAEQIGEDETADGPILALGPTKRDDVVRGPSVKQVTKTAGGVTKLVHALNLCVAKDRLQPLPTDGYIHFTESFEAHGALSRLFEHIERGAITELVVDIETSGDINEDVPDGDAIIMIGLYTGDGDPLVFSGECLADAHVRLLFHDCFRLVNTLIAWNGKFDTKWLSLFCGEEVRCDYDPMLLHYIMYPGAGEHGLKQVAERILGVGDWDAPLKKYTTGKKGFENIPTNILAYYNACDVYYTYHLARFLENTADQRELDLLEDFIMPASHMLQEVEDNGIMVDRHYLTTIGEELNEKRDRVLSRLHALTAHVDFRSATDMKRKNPIPMEKKPFNPNSPMQVKKYLETSTGKKVYKTDVNALDRLLEKGVETDFIQSLLEHRKLSKMLDTYVNGLLHHSRRDSRVYSTFKLHGTVTGRLSSSNPNIQNIPRDAKIRTAFISDESQNKVLVGCDYSQAELRTMAELSSDEEMIAAFQEDAPDFFDNLMPSAYPGMPAERFDHDHPGYKELRAKIKGVVYGMSYGRRAAAIAAALDMPIWEAEAIIDGYLVRFPDFARWRDSIMPRVDEGTLITPFGRRYQQDVITSKQLIPIENSALSFLPQSTASDICVTAAMDVHQIIKSSEPKTSTKIVALVHDAITLECDAEDAEAWLQILKTQMRLAATTVFNRVPFLTDGKINTRWDKV